MQKLLALALLLLTTPAWAEDYLVGMVHGDSSIEVIARVRDGAILPFEGEGAPPAEDPVFVGSYRIFGLGKELGTVEGGPLEYVEPGYFAAPVAEPLPLPERPFLATTSPLASLPPDLQVLDLNDPTVKAAARKLLDDNGLASSPLQLWQAFKCDLDLDGTPEIVMAGSLVAGMITENPLDGYYANDGQGKPGDYYLLAVFHEDSVGSLAPVWSQIEARPQYPIMVEAFAVADVNGDRVPEIGIFFRGYEWATWELHGWNGKELIFIAGGGYAA